MPVLLYIRHGTRRAAVRHSSTSTSSRRAFSNSNRGSDNNPSPAANNNKAATTTTTTATKRPRRPTPAGTFVWRDLPYYHSPDRGQGQGQDPKHCLDVYVAAAPFPRAPQPVLVFVHGGLWVRGDRQHPYIPDLYDNVGAACARAGMVGVVISYRLAPQVQHPEQCRDVARALRWAQRHAPRFGGDPGRLVLAGASAGAHLCTTLLASPDLLQEEETEELEPAPVPPVRGLVALSGVFNLERLMHKGGGALAAASLLPAVFGDDPARWPQASPTHLLRAHLRARRRVPLQRTPLLLLNAAADFHLGEDTAELLGLLAEGDGGGDGAGVHRATHVVPGTDHISLVREVGKAKAKEKGKGGGGVVVDDLVFGFVRRVLGQEEQGQQQRGGGRA